MNSPAQVWTRKLVVVMVSALASLVRPSTDPDDLYRRACVLWGEDRREAAIATLDEALRRRPDFPEGLAMGGFMLGVCGAPDAALRFYSRALELDPSQLNVRLNAGKLLFELGRFAEARDAFESATRSAPDEPDAWNCLSGALCELGRMEESLAAGRRALALKPGFPEAAINVGNALLKLDRMEEALAVYAAACARRPDHGAAHCGRAHALRNLGRFEEALAAYETSERLGCYEAIGGKGCLMLTLGDFARGWEGYEARWRKGRSVAERFGARFPEWTGPSARAGKVLVFNDHGLGDTIQFVRYLPLMAAAGVETTFVAPERMWRLLRPTIPTRFVEAPPAEPFDAQIALSSLPRALATRLDSVPCAIPYLAPEPALVAKWAARIGPAGFRVGVVWQGNSHPEVDRARSVPLAALKPLAEIARVRLIALQKGFGVEQLDHLPPDMQVERLGDDFDAGPDAFADTAAVMQNLDLVVACDTSLAHLAGALGRPVWAALKTDAEWRWLTERCDSPWYPTARLFRQSRRGVWDDVFEAMARELAALVAARFPARRMETPVSAGELLDKITILRIKSARICDAGKLAHVRAELALLERLAEDEGLVGSALAALTGLLAQANGRLWDIEDALRVAERACDFGPRFVALARSVYVVNDERAALKRQINDFLGSPLVEEKSYA